MWLSLSYLMWHGGWPTLFTFTQPQYQITSNIAQCIHASRISLNLYFTYNENGYTQQQCEKNTRNGEKTGIDRCNFERVSGGAYLNVFCGGKHVEGFVSLSDSTSLPSVVDGENFFQWGIRYVASLSLLASSIIYICKMNMFMVFIQCSNCNRIQQAWNNSKAAYAVTKIENTLLT